MRNTGRVTRRSPSSVVVCDASGVEHASAPRETTEVGAAPGVADDPVPSNEPPVDDSRVDRRDLGSSAALRVDLAVIAPRRVAAPHDGRDRHCDASSRPSARRADQLVSRRGTRPRPAASTEPGPRARGPRRSDDERPRLRRRLVGDDDGRPSRRASTCGGAAAARGGACFGRGAGERGRVDPVRAAAGAARARGVQRRAVAFVSPHQPGQCTQAGAVLEHLERGRDLRALAVGLVEPHAGPVRAGAEVVRVRAAGDVDERRVRRPALCDVAPRPALGGLVLGEDRLLGLLVGAEPDLHELPVALVLAAADQRAEQLEVVVVVEEPVLEPQPALAVAPRVAVDAVAVARPGGAARRRARRSRASCRRSCRSASTGRPSA